MFNTEKGMIMAVARVVIDRSASMESRKQTVAPAVNGFFGNLLKDPTGKEALCWITTFDSMGFDVIRKGRVAMVKPLAPEEYVPRALTPLLDAVGAAIGELDELNDPKTMLAILTDGRENASRRFDLAQIHEMIEERRRRGWIIIYLGANINAWEEAAKLGIPNEHAINFTQGSGPASAGASGGVGPLAIALIATAGIATAWWAMSSSPAQDASIPGFDEATRNAAMNVDGVTTTWSGAVTAEVDAFVEPFNSVYDLPGDLAAEALALPDDFDPSLGSVDAHGMQAGATEEGVLGNDVADTGASGDGTDVAGEGAELPEAPQTGATGSLAGLGVADSADTPNFPEGAGMFDNVAASLGDAASATSDGIATAAGAMGDVASAIAGGIADAAGGVADAIGGLFD